ncbi:FKBP-type peptidyl-prolyl cis-trans isomerase FkpA [Pseudoduganella lurida]|uniref:Peptidyl-prolyl cis-trans isomerase n=1 Tax=Pseudoduganella lurida TaxID=1036180 RepID=A0A562R1I7_9BURK|nr:FKBP-type peptidyl-prolyl cis-trans isomerase [Pseudoduganella lurida]TWI62945.1 FKBP-type peptidyl-prolyl cis-trans isomerase FkpA [Pseudoduganella lurida]
MKSMFKLLATLACAMALTACGGGDDDVAIAAPAVANLSQIDMTVGTGIEATAGDSVTVAYSGWVYDSTKTDNKGSLFDSATSASPFTFVLGKGTVIAGWDQGVPGMKVGGKRRLTIPASLAYGAQSLTAANGTVIPANSPLVFEIEVLAIKR